MADTNVEFLSLYNQLNDFLRDISGINFDGDMLLYLEHIPPKKTGFECRAARTFKNILDAQNGVRPEVPGEWVDWLLNVLDYCKAHSEGMASKLRWSFLAHRDAADVRNEQYSETPALSRSPGFDIDDYVEAKAEVIKTRIDNLEQEFKEFAIPNVARKKIADSAKCYLDCIRATTSKKEADCIFEAYQRAFENLKSHPIVLKVELERYKKKQEKTIKEKIESLSASFRKKGQKYLDKLLSATTIDQAKKINREFKSFFSKVKPQGVLPKYTESAAADARHEEEEIKELSETKKRRQKFIILSTVIMAIGLLIPGIVVLLLSLGLTFL